MLDVAEFRRITTLNRGSIAEPTGHFRPDRQYRQYVLGPGETEPFRRPHV